MKVQNVSTVFFANKSASLSFKKAQFVESPDLKELIDYASTDKTAMMELLVCMEMLAHKNKNTMLSYNASNNGEIYVTNLNTGNKIIKINEYNRPSMRENLKSLSRFAMPSDEEHQKLLGEGMSRHQAQELKDAASLAVYESIQKHPATAEIKVIQKNIDKLENEKSKKLKEIIFSKVVKDVSY